MATIHARTPMKTPTENTHEYAGYCIPTLCRCENFCGFAQVLDIAEWDDRTRLIAKSARDLVDQEAPQGSDEQLLLTRSTVRVDMAKAADRQFIMVMADDGCFMVVWNISRVEGLHCEGCQLDCNTRGLKVVRMKIVDWDMVDWKGSIGRWLIAHWIDWRMADWRMADWRMADWRMADCTMVDCTMADWKMVDSKMVDWIDWKMVDWRMVDWKMVDCTMTNCTMVDLKMVTMDVCGRPRVEGRNVGRWMLNIALWYGGCRMMDGGHGGCVVMIVIVVKRNGQGGRPRWKANVDETRVGRPERTVVTADGGNDCHDDQSWKTRVGRPELEDQSWKTRVGRPELEDQSWKTRVGRPELEDQSWKTRVGRPELEDQSWKTRVGRPELEDQSWKTRVGRPERIVVTVVPPSHQVAMIGYSERSMMDGGHGQVEGQGDSQVVKTRNSRHRGLNHHHIRVVSRTICSGKVAMIAYSERSMMDGGHGGKKLEQKNKKVVGQVEGQGDSQSVKTRNSRHRGLNHHHIRVSKAKLAQNYLCEKGMKGGCYRELFMVDGDHGGRTGKNWGRGRVSTKREGGGRTGRNWGRGRDLTKREGAKPSGPHLSSSCLTLPCVCDLWYYAPRPLWFLALLYL
ncbi:hypothetical protein PCH_Pc13g05960 [Penicillium rubens Wisconsin 54-1255]|uniref:Uncharacterized protein n=1 Tax=Penicillium rubens (strain ATCC 28089 / DSM 1075 / NRRL 1951 / Wisconsin 54-1255) TaxID=500485 RepID=B6H384_PENRW|nr:hypothetical protein PCH_Pc13g05960 [Penicillium rubens Wisconsin 54-1255]